MTSLGRVLVGYRHNDRRRLTIERDYGVHYVAIRKCAADCGYDVYFNASGLDAAHNRDPEVLCEECASLYHRELKAEL
jgi:hypothetical protein